MTTSLALPAEFARTRRAVLGAFLVLGMASGSWASRIPDIRHHLDLSDGALGTALLGLSVGAVVGAWTGGQLVKRFGSRRVVSRSWLVVSCCLILPGLAGAAVTLGLAFLTLGLAVGVLDVSMNGAGVQVEAAAGRPVLSGLHAGWSGGVLAGAAIGNAAVAVDIDPLPHFAVVGIAMAAAGLWARAHIPDGRIEATHIETTGSRGTKWTLVALAGIGGCVFLGEGVAIDWGGVYLRDELGGGPVLASLAVTGVSTGGLIGRLLGDWLTTRLGPARLVRVGAVLAIAGLGSALLLSSAVPGPVLFALLGLGLAPAVPLAFAAAGRRRGEHGIAVVTTAGYGAYLGGPALIGWLAEGIGLRGALIVPVLLAAIVAALAWSTD